MARGESKLGFRLTRKRIEMGILTPELLTKYQAIQEAEGFKVELAAAQKTAAGFKLPKGKDVVDPTKEIRKALQNVNHPEQIAAFVGVKRGPGRPKGSTNKAKEAAPAKRGPGRPPKVPTTQDNKPYIPIHLLKAGAEKKLRAFLVSKVA